MEKICSECGKICGSNAHSNFKLLSSFSGQTLCGFCFNKYKNDLEARLLDNFKQGSTLHRFGPANLPPNFRQLSYREQQPFVDRNNYQLKILEEQYKRLQQQYTDLTGVKWNPPQIK
ncbi:hypothetical protein [Bacteroides sp. 519]|uniref:hypothetical protein n=1 Tax=Bacteroides sp. 519 TaxID=2302937 RepID=UPI0013D8A879|nr:hypothetical protein [Bacteroides sp. 519]NDV59107.1 hypothetical protein [Bacteroides sp. 519]